MKVAVEIEHRVINCAREHLSVSRALLDDAVLLAHVSEAGQLLVDALRRKAKVFFFGNGGSAADAQHLAAELAGRFLRERRALPGLALTTNSSCLTAIGNDYSYEVVFARQIEALGTSGDVAIAISTSGNSTNVLRAVEMARTMGLFTLGLTGRDGGQLRELAHLCLRVPSDHTPRIQEMHILLGHILCEIAEEGVMDDGSLPRS
jgi:D-sedoheptulose 7-phosphate isomerase